MITNLLLHIVMKEWRYKIKQYKICVKILTYDFIRKKIKRKFKNSSMDFFLNPVFQRVKAQMLYYYLIF